MNYIKHLTGFFDRIKSEESLLPTHISLYMALFQSWNVNRFNNPTRITSEEMMSASKIYSRVTYHKCLSKLVAMGLLQYHPSYSPIGGSFIVMKNLSSDSRPIKPAEVRCSSNEQQSEQVAVQLTEQVDVQAYIYNNKQTIKNISNKVNFDIYNHHENSDVQFLNNHSAALKEKKSSAKKKEIPAIPNLEEVHQYFQSHRVTGLEAKKFFSYYESKGWLVGNSIMRNWRAAAEHWILNMPKFNPTSTTLEPGVLRASVLKNYNEPL